MHIFITGGTGLIGRSLIRELSDRGNKITVLTRDVIKARNVFKSSVDFYCPSLDALETLDDYDAVINLAGEPIVGKRWSERQKEVLCESRWSITYRLSELIKNSTNPPQVFISGSAVGYYGAQNGKTLTERSHPHDEFLHQLCYKWEQLAADSESDRTRVCVLRTGIVLSKDGGMLPKMILPFRFGLGSVFGRGDQYISWIHIQDMVDGILFLLNNFDAKGVFNLTAPNPETNKMFSRKLAAAMSRPCLFHLPKFLLKIILGEMSTMVVDGQRVVSENLLKSGYRFSFENLDDALEEIFEHE